MFCLLMSFTFAAAPIPKVSTYEGNIAFLIQKPEAGILILSPAGQEIKRFALKDLKGNPSSVRLIRNMKGVCVETTENENQPDGRVRTRVYLVDPEQKSKPAVIADRKDHFTWAVDRDGENLYLSAVDLDAKVKPNELHPHQHFQIRIQSGKSEKLELPKNVSIVDIAQEDDSLLTYFFGENGRDGSRAAIYSIKTAKRTFLADDQFDSLVISPDAKQIMISDRVNDPLRNFAVLRYQTFDVKTKAKKIIDLPDDAKALTAYAFGTKDRICVTSIGTSNAGGGIQNQKIYVIHLEGSKKQLIYETKENEVLYDCDWR